MTEGTLEKPSFPSNTADAAQGLIKLVALSNAGGVAATITVIGATAKNSCLMNILALPLSLFSFGVVFSIAYALSLSLRIAKHEGFEPSPIKWLVSDYFTRFSGNTAVILFVLGCLAGASIVAFS